MKTSLLVRGFIVLALLWGMIYGLIIGAYALILYFGYQEAALGTLLFTWIPVLIALGIVFLQFLISPWLLDLSFGWMHKLTWIQPDQLPPHLAKFVAEQSQIHGISIKKIGMIHDQMPQALTYGRFKKSARIVLSDGTLNLLTPKEQIGVVAHEIGHIAHMDFLFMTLASAVPMILYVFYIFSRGFVRSMAISSGGSRDNRGAAAMMAGAAAAMVISYVFYFISQFLVLFLSRVREYYADRFSGENTNNPKGLSTALVKIAYGMVKSQSAYAIQMNDKKTDNRTRTTYYRRSGFVNATRSLNIFDIKAANSLVMTAYAQTAEVTAEAVVKAAAWDLESPWAGFIELQSTHPLAAKRLLALDDLSVELKKPRTFPTLGTDQIKESLWNEFFVDLFLMYFVPALTIILPGGAGLVTYFYYLEYMWYAIGGGLAISGLLWLWRLRIRYPKLDQDLPLINIMGAVTDVSDDGYAEASPFRGKPILLEGTIIGRGSPGYYFSEDVVLQDPSGIVVLDYNPAFGFMRFFTAIFRVEKMIGSKVKAVGWYRRGPRPTVMIKRILRKDGSTFGSNRDFFNKIFIGLLFLVALICIFYGIKLF